RVKPDGGTTKVLGAANMDSSSIRTLRKPSSTGALDS
ncbi:MAG: hypothetical protein ACI82F_004687, partial [Planctomycetota bacterium]